MKLDLGRQVKLRHFRNGTELPWMSYDDFYHFDYQQNRQLSNQIQVLPGDQISYGKIRLINRSACRYLYSQKLLQGCASTLKL